MGENLKDLIARLKQQKSQTATTKPTITEQKKEVVEAGIQDEDEEELLGDEEEQIVKPVETPKVQEVFRRPVERIVEKPVERMPEVKSVEQVNDQAEEIAQLQRDVALLQNNGVFRRELLTQMSEINLSNKIIAEVLLKLVGD
jgi:phosphoenolpyruvate carboxylase